MLAVHGTLDNAEVLLDPQFEPPGLGRVSIGEVPVSESVRSEITPKGSSESGLGADHWAVGNGDNADELHL